jgi:hypothetical protein
MSWWNWISDQMATASSSAASASPCEPTVINPGSGLPMIGGISGIDVAGNTFGVSSHAHDHNSSSHSWHDHSHSGCGSIGGYDPMRGW